jgi:hypothetical protein
MIRVRFTINGTERHFECELNALPREGEKVWIDRPDVSVKGETATIYAVVTQVTHRVIGSDHDAIVYLELVR